MRIAALQDALCHWQPGAVFHSRNDWRGSRISALGYVARSELEQLAAQLGDLRGQALSGDPNRFAINGLRNMDAFAHTETAGVAPRVLSGSKGRVMTKTVQCKVHGRTIELDEDLGVADGQVVEVQVNVVGLKKKLPGPPSGWRPGSKKTAAGMLADSWTEEDDRILEEIYRDRRRETRPSRPLVSVPV
jgi:hypothetical protein